MAESILPHNATAWMRAVETASAERWSLGIDGLFGSLNPLTCSAHLLPWLAQTRGLDLWFDDWSEETKRRAIAAMPRLSRLKGTVAGLRGYLDLVGVPVTYVQTPPEDGWFGGDLSEADRAAWLGRLPQLRVYPFRDADAVVDGDGFFSEDFLNDEADADGSAFGLEDAFGFMGERLFIRRGNAEAPLTILSQSTARGPLGERIDVAVAAEPRADTGDALGDAALEDTFAGVDDGAGLISIRLQPAADYGAMRPVPFSRQTVAAPFELVFEPSEPNPEDAFFGAGFLCDEQGAGSLFGEDDATEFVYRRAYLDDPAVRVPDLDGDCLWGEHIFGFPADTAILGVDLSEPVPDGEQACDGSGEIGATYFDEPEFPRLARAVEAVRRGQGGTDIILLDTVTFSPLRAGDAARLGDRLKLGQMIERHIHE